MIRSFIATLLSASFALQLLLAGGTVCAMPHGERASPTGQAEMMESAAMAGMDVSHQLDEPALSASDSQSSSSDAPIQPCEAPATPPSNHCAAPCSATLTVAPPVQSDETVHGATHALPTTAVELSSRSESPEPPPPRA